MKVDFFSSLFHKAVHKHLWQAVALDVRLQPLELVGVLLLADALVHLAARLVGAVQRVHEVLMVRVVSRSVAQNLGWYTQYFIFKSQTCVRIPLFSQRQCVSLELLDFLPLSACPRANVREFRAPMMCCANNSHLLNHERVSRDTLHGFQEVAAEGHSLRFRILLTNLHEDKKPCISDRATLFFNF